jgi:hypothetical protein
MYTTYTFDLSNKANVMKTIKQIKATKYNYTVIAIKKDGSFAQYGNGSVKIENAQKNANYWNKNFNFSTYPDYDFFDIAILDKNN